MSEATADEPTVPRTRIARWVKVGVTAGLILVALSVAYAATSMFWAVSQVRSDADNLQASLAATDPAEISTDLTSLVASAGELARVADSFPWSIVGHLPVLGDTVSGMGAISRSAAALGQAALPVVDLAANGSTNTERLAALVGSQPQFEALALAARQAQGDVSTVDPGSLLFGLDEPVRTYQDALPELADRAEAAATAVGFLPGLLGSDERRTWLVLLQNPAEARGSGGLFSGYALVEVNDGQPTILEAQTRKRALDEFDIPYEDVVPWQPAFLWGPALGMWASFNLSGDFPMVAQLASAGMEARGTPVDGVIAVDAFAVEAMLAGTGPVEHRGVTLDGTNAAAFFTKDLYAQYPDFPDVEAKDELALGLVYATIDAVLKRPLDLRALLERMPAAVESGHVKIWSPDAAEQGWLASVGMAGDIASLDPRTALVTLNNSTGGKLDAYVTPTLTYVAGICRPQYEGSEGLRRSAIRVSLANDAPLGLPDYVDVRLDDPEAPSGSTRLQVYLYGPEGSSLRQMYVDETFPPVVVGTEAGRSVWGAGAEVLRDSTTDVWFVFDEPDTDLPEAPVVLPGSAIDATLTVQAVNSTELCPAAAEDLPTVEELNALAG